MNAMRHSFKIHYSTGDKNVKAYIVTENIGQKMDSYNLDLILFGNVFSNMYVIGLSNP